MRRVLKNRLLWPIGALVALVIAEPSSANRRLLWLVILSVLLKAVRCGWIGSPMVVSPRTNRYLSDERRLVWTA